MKNSIYILSLCFSTFCMIQAGENPKTNKAKKEERLKAIISLSKPWRQSAGGTSFEYDPHQFLAGVYNYPTDPKNPNRLHVIHGTNSKR